LRCTNGTQVGEGTVIRATLYAVCVAVLLNAALLAQAQQTLDQQFKLAAAMYDAFNDTRAEAILQGLIAAPEFTSASPDFKRNVAVLFARCEDRQKNREKFLEAARMLLEPNCDVQFQDIVENFLRVADSLKQACIDSEKVEFAIEPIPVVVVKPGDIGKTIIRVSPGTHRTQIALTNPSPRTQLQEIDSVSAALYFTSEKSDAGKTIPVEFIVAAGDRTGSGTATFRIAKQKKKWWPWAVGAAAAGAATYLILQPGDDPTPLPLPPSPPGKKTAPSGGGETP